MKVIDCKGPTKQKAMAFGRSVKWAPRYVILRAGGSFFDQLQRATASLG